MVLCQAFFRTKELKFSLGISRLNVLHAVYLVVKGDRMMWASKCPKIHPNMKNLFQRCDTKMLIKTNLIPATAIGPDGFQNGGVALTLGRSYIETRGSTYIIRLCSNWLYSMHKKDVLRLAFPLFH